MSSTDTITLTIIGPVAAVKGISGNILGNGATIASRAKDRSTGIMTITVTCNADTDADRVRRRMGASQYTSRGVTVKSLKSKPTG